MRNYLSFHGLSRKHQLRTATDSGDFGDAADETVPRVSMYRSDFTARSSGSEGASYAD